MTPTSYKAIIVDDEKNSTEMLEWQLQKYCPQIQVSATCNSPEDGLSAVASFNPDVVFLDIEMPRMNGFEWLKQISPYQFKLIFTTAYDKFAIKAIRFSALDYLLKPIDSDDLKAAVAKLDLQVPNQLVNAQISQLLQNIKDIHSPQNKIIIPTQESIEFIRLDAIVRLESSGNYTTIYMKDGSKMLTSKSLKEFEEMLCETGVYYRVHHSHIINMDCIKRYVREDGGYLQLTDDTQVPVSRSRKEAFMNFIGQ